MATRKLTANVVKADGTPFTGVLRVTPLEEIFADGTTVAVTLVEYAVTTGALPASAKVVVPGRYAFALLDGEEELQCFQAYVPAETTEISLFDLIADTYLCPPADTGTSFLVAGSSITLLGRGSGTDGQFLTVIDGAVAWADVVSGGGASFTYVVYAEDDAGTGFTTTFDADLDYIAIKTTTIPLSPPAAYDFTGLWKKYKGEPGQDGANGEDGTDGSSAFVYVGYAEDGVGTGFTTIFDPDLDYIAILTTTVPLPSPTATDFSGLWKKYKGERGENGADSEDGVDGDDGASAYLYIAYASNASGTGFTTVFDPALDYIAIKTTTAPRAAPSAADFAGLWKKYKGETGAAGASAFVYIAYASDAVGTGFTTTFNPALDFIAVKATAMAIPSPSAADFAGLWKRYKGEPGAAGADGEDGAPGSRWYTGLGGPEPTLGIEHDLYLHTESGDVYEKIGEEWEVITNIIGPPGATLFDPGYMEYALIEERKPAGQHGGNATAGADEVRLFNAVVTNNSGLSDAALLDGATGTIRLMPGLAYHIRAEIQGSLVEAFKAIIRSTDGMSLNIDGKAINVDSNFGLNGEAHVECFVTVIGSPLDIRVLHRVSRTQPVTGRGNALNAPGGSPLLGGAFERYGTLVRSNHGNNR